MQDNVNDIELFLLLKMIASSQNSKKFIFFNLFFVDQNYSLHSVISNQNFHTLPIFQNFPINDPLQSSRSKNLEEFDDFVTSNTSNINTVTIAKDNNKKENNDEDFTEFVGTSDSNKFSETPRTIYQKYSVFDEVSEASNLQIVPPMNNSYFLNQQAFSNTTKIGKRQQQKKLNYKIIKFPLRARMKLIRIRRLPKKFQT